ncbi:peroxisomal sarcosine oxidase-like [Oratosquilla oratoria]|uniref:peroxisomal sarcosine oxidase-like n=1 Tax=Oratosquilla oratoria TaxID=337810 RepID=UPI003F76F9CD
MFEAAGGQVLDLWPVRGIEPGPVVTIKGDKGEIRAKAVILWLGPWTTKALTGLGVQVPIWAGKTAALFWKIKDPKLPSFSFVDISVQNAYYYMLPSIEYPGYLKIGLHASKEVDPDNREFVDVSFLREKVTKYIKKVFPGVDPKCAIEEWCIYQRTPDEEMVVDHLPNHRNIVYASGFSGMGFKVAPTVGEALYRMALNLPPKFDLSFFSPKRFQARSKM